MARVALSAARMRRRRFGAPVPDGAVRPRLIPGDNDAFIPPLGVALREILTLSARKEKRVSSVFQEALLCGREPTS